jgi:hypothetical protein
LKCYSHWIHTLNVLTSALVARLGPRFEVARLQADYGFGAKPARSRCLLKNIQKQILQEAAAFPWALVITGY